MRRFVGVVAFALASAAPEAHASRNWVVNGEQGVRDDLLSTVAFYDAQEEEPFCTGTLVLPDVVMTAAHCFANEDDTAFLDDFSTFSVVVGALDANFPDDEPEAKRYAFEDVHLECAWLTGDNRFSDDASSFGRDDDIAFVVLAEEVPAEVMEPTGFLPDSMAGELAMGAEVLVSGYGIYDVETEDAGVLHVGTTTVSRTNTWEIMTSRNADGLGTDTCSGDSGGPLYMYGSDDALYVVGLTARGTSDSDYDCGDGGIYTRPEPYLELYQRAVDYAAPIVCTPDGPVEPDPEPEPEPEPDPGDPTTGQPQATPDVQDEGCCTSVGSRRPTPFALVVLMWVVLGGVRRRC